MRLFVRCTKPVGVTAVVSTAVPLNAYVKVFVVGTDATTKVPLNVESTPVTATS